MTITSTRTPDRRQARRYATPTEQQNGILESNDRQVRVQLRNESATGFLVELDIIPKYAVGETLRLHTRAGSFEVKVAYTRPADYRFQVGLRRINELIKNEDSTDRKGILFSILRAILGQLGFLLFQPLVYIVATVMISAIAFAYQYASNPNNGSATAPGAESVAPPESVEPPSASQGRQMRNDLMNAKLRGLRNLVSSPEYMDALGLDETQRQQIQDMVFPCLEAVHREQVPTDVKAKEVENTYVDVLEILSLKQRTSFLRTCLRTGSRESVATGQPEARSPRRPKRNALPTGPTDS